MAQAAQHVLVSFSPCSLLGSQNNACFVLRGFFLSIGYSNVKQKLFQPKTGYQCYWMHVSFYLRVWNLAVV